MFSRAQMASRGHMRRLGVLRVLATPMNQAIRAISVAGSERTGLSSSATTAAARRCFAARAKKGARSSKGRGVGEDSDAAPKKQLALSMALKQVEMAYGKGAVMQLGSAEVAKVEVIPTGSLSLDHALGVGGLPRGRVVEVYGPESSGKTTVALHAVAKCQKAGGTAVFIDAEHALDSAYAKAIGVDMTKLYLAQPDNGEQALDIVDTLVKSAAVDMVVVDSVAALVPKAELEGEMGDHHIALQARLMSQALRKLTAILNTTRCTLIFINQIRQKVGVVFGSPDVTSGGMALRFYSSVRLEVRKGQAIKQNGEIIGTKVKVKVAKNKLAPPFGKAEVDLMYGKGFDLQGELLDLGCTVGLLSKSGAWFGVSAAMGVDGTELAGQASPWLMGQGREKSKAFLLANPRLSEKLKAAVIETLSAGESCGNAGAVGDVPSDPPSLASSTEPSDVADDAVPESATGDASVSSPGGVLGKGGEREEVVEAEGVLLEPGVGSVEELFESDVFSKAPAASAQGGGSSKGSGLQEGAANAEEKMKAI
ncbi:unnamed protein product [Ectocarpus sp. CCAP 1310/34]|nr:unnamed protein product [Ectocarpus sp. CCAP 1310/34]